MYKHALSFQSEAHRLLFIIKVSSLEQLSSAQLPQTVGGNLRNIYCLTPNRAAGAVLPTASQEKKLQGC